MADPAQIDPTLESLDGSDDNRLDESGQMNPAIEPPESSDDNRLGDAGQMNPPMEISESSADNRLGNAGQINPNVALPDNPERMFLDLQSPSGIQALGINVILDEQWSSPEDSVAGLAEGGQEDPTVDPDEFPTDSKFDFADDIITEVYAWITGVDLPTPKVRSPVNPDYKLREVHKMYIQEFLDEEGIGLKKKVEERRPEKPWSYDEDAYKELKREFVNKFKDAFYSEKSFVRLCAAVAIAAIGNQSLEENADVAELASEELYNFINQVLKPDGNMRNSEWAEDFVV